MDLDPVLLWGKKREETAKQQLHQNHFQAHSFSIHQRAEVRSGPQLDITLF